MYRPYAHDIISLSIIESSGSIRKYTEVTAILSGKNVEWVAVGNSISCRLSVLVR